MLRVWAYFVFLVVSVSVSEAQGLGNEKCEIPKEYIEKIKLYLYVDIMEKDGAVYTGSAIANTERNGLPKGVGISDKEAFEKIRKAIEADQKKNNLEYTARTLISGANTRSLAPPGKATREQYQKALWDIFLLDENYMNRLCRELFGREVRPPVLVARKTEVERVLNSIRKTFSELPGREGCNAKPITAFGDLSQTDPFLAVAVFEILTGQKVPIPLEKLSDALRTKGWLVIE